MSDAPDRRTGSPTRPGDERQRSRRIALKITIAVLIAVTAAVMFWQWALAWVPAALAAIIYVMDLIIARIERNAAQEDRLGSMPEAERQRVVERAKVAVGFKTGLTIILALAAIAIVIAAAFLDWKLVGIGALAIFAWLVLFGLPFWIAAIDEEADMEREQLTGKSRSIH